MRKSLLMATLLYSGSCLDQYTHPDVDINADILVVDGFLSTNNKGFIKLSRVSVLSEKEVVLESGAQLKLESVNGVSISLVENEPGTYSLEGNQSPIVGESYQLIIKVIGGQEYVSEFVKTMKTPEIDSVYWRGDIPNGNVVILVTTQNSSFGTGNYRWRFGTTWKYRTRFGIPEFHLCWRTDPSTQVLIGSTENLKMDVVSDKLITTVPWTSVKLRDKYSILVEQYALSDDEYEYWRLLKKNTENLGTLFDAQPSQISSNLSNVADPEDVVLGYFSIYDPKEARIFITKTDIAEVFGIVPLILDSCKAKDSEPLKPGCTDCRVGGGINKKPDFWID